MFDIQQERGLAGIPGRRLAAWIMFSVLIG
jgi:hypothetical protein